MGFLSKLLGRDNTARRDAKLIYSKVMDQSRNPAFYGENRAPDNYDGRIDMLTLHLAPIMAALRAHGEQGHLLSQEIYEVMRVDFDIALREEGLTDSSITHRIKPMIALFFTRVKAYTEGLESKAPHETLEAALTQGLLKEEDAPAFASALATYLQEFGEKLTGKTLGELALAAFEFPKLPK